MEKPLEAAGLNTAKPPAPSMTDPVDLTSGRLLARNTLLNLALGVDRCGILTLCIMVVGYFGLFYLGLGQA